MQFTFEDCCLDLDRRELWRNANRIAVEPQVFDLLVHLLRNRDRVVSTDDLLDAVWGGRIVSDATLASRIKAARIAVGDSGALQRVIRTLPRKGFRLVSEVHVSEGPFATVSAKAIPAADSGDQSRKGHGTSGVTFCRTKDGTNIAMASIGQGLVVVRAAHWATNLDFDWENQITGPLLQRLSHRYRLVRYDGRGTGLSDRNTPTISFATMSDDLESVVEAVQIERFALLGISGGAATSIAYAVAHPDRVSKLVLLGGYARGRNKRGASQDADEAMAFLTMLRSGWGHEHSVFMRAFCSFFLPGASPAEVRSFIDFQRVATTGENGVKLRRGLDDIDILQLLPKVTVPTLVFHCRQDNLVPFDQGRQLAAMIPNARFVSLDSANHALLSSEPAWAAFVEETERFLSEAG